MGFYGPSDFLSALHEMRGWPLADIDSHMTHFLVGAVTAFKLPILYGRFGPSNATRTGILFMAFGTMGWAAASEPGSYSLQPP